MRSIDYASDQTKGKRVKSLDRLLHWIKHQVEQNIHLYQYVTSDNNLADLPTKQFPRQRHVIFHLYFFVKSQITTLTPNPNIKVIVAEFVT